MEPDFQSYRQKLYSQVEEAYGKVVYTYTTQIIHAGRLKKRNRNFKWAEIILSAISTGGFIMALIQSQIVSVWVGGISSTILLIISSYLKDIDFSKAEKAHLDTSNKLWLLKEKYLSLLTDFSTMNESEIQIQRNLLRDEMAKIVDTAPITDSKSYALAQDALKNKEMQSFSREELNKLLPKSLQR